MLLVFAGRRNTHRIQRVTTETFLQCWKTQNYNDKKREEKRQNGNNRPELTNKVITR